MLIPFSSLLSQVTYEVKGFKLVVDDELNPVSVSAVEPLKIENERFISDQHAVCLYTDRNSLDKGIKSHTDCFKEKQIEDYVLLVLKAHPDFHEHSVRATAKGLEDIASQFGGRPAKTYEELREIMPEFNYMIYSAVQVMSKAKYWQIIQNDTDQYNEIIEISEGMDDDELLHTLHEYAVDNLEPRPFNEHYEIGYPAKLSKKILEDEGWVIIDTIRKGKLKENELLSDETLINELSGDGGSNKQRYSKDFYPSNVSAIEQIKKDINRCLVDNAIWLTGIEKAIAELSKASGEKAPQSRIHVFNPSNTLLSLFQSATSSSQVEAMRWIPSYYINTEHEETKTAYFGCLVRNGKKTSLQDVLTSAYSGSAMGLLLSLTWGGYQSNDIDICPLYGLEYANFKCAITKESQVFFKFDGYRYMPCDPVDPYYEYFQFIHENPDLIQDIVDMFGEATLTPGIVKF